ncbi:fibronectin type III-like domain-contianing protein [Streptomyces mirabilis]|uniref:fibronectin type III-like domain-contianing protein n=1 Tax=Streptomyces mirabilis TaxID=68239 RepID=UPI003570DB7F
MPQVYVGRACQDGADFVPRLAAFDRVHLEAGQSRSVELRLEPRVLARWDDIEGALASRAATTRSASGRMPSTRTARPRPSSSHPHSCTGTRQARRPWPTHPREESRAASVVIGYTTTEDVIGEIGGVMSEEGNRLLSSAGVAESLRVSEVTVQNTDQAWQLPA